MEEKNKEEKDKKRDSFNRVFIAIIAFLIVFSFFASISHRLVVFRSEFLANIFPRVLVDLTNSYRSSSRLSQLTVNPLLEEAASKKAEDMAQNGYFAHTSPDGVTPWYWFGDVGYDFSYAGENLAIHFSDSNDVVRAWMDSPGHRDNILNQYFTEIGIATAKGFYQGRETTFVVQLFGHPRGTSRVALQEDNTQLAVQGQQELNLVENEQEQEGGSGETSDILEEENQDNDLVEEFEVLGNLQTNDEGSEESGSQKFVAVQSADSDSATGSENVYPNQDPGQATLIEEIITSPSVLFSIVYFVFGVLALVFIILALVSEIRKHHYLHIAYGVGLLLLILVLYFVYQFAFTEVEVLLAT